MFISKLKKQIPLANLVLIKEKNTSGFSYKINYLMLVNFNNRQ